MHCAPCERTILLLYCTFIARLFYQVYSLRRELAVTMRSSMHTLLYETIYRQKKLRHGHVIVSLHDAPDDFIEISNGQGTFAVD